MDDLNCDCHFLSLSDYSLLHIFSYVSATTLYQLSRTCKRFNELVKEKKLWHRIDARDEPIDKNKVDFCINNVNDRTTQLFLAATDRSQVLSTYKFLTSDVTKNLRILAIENQLIQGDLLTLAEYPVTLVEISFRKSFVVNFAHFFRHTDQAMKNLKVLILDECGWVETDMMVPFSKYPKLEILSLYMCKKLSDNDISYLSLAGCFGFKSLRVLDVRFTGLGDQILKTFYKHKTLSDLYFQSYMESFALEKSQRKLQLVIGCPLRKHPYLSVFDDIPDTDPESMRTFFGKHTYKTHRMQALSDEGVIMYKFVEPDLTQDYVFDSVLYEPPYSRCQCGFYESDGGDAKPKTCGGKKKFETDKTEIARLERVIAWQQHVKYLPHLYMLKPKLHLDPRRSQNSADDYEVEASFENKSLRWLNLREPKNEYEIAMLEHTDLHALSPELSTNNIVIDFRPLSNDAAINFDDGDASSDITVDSIENEEAPVNVAVFRKLNFGDEDASSDNTVDGIENEEAPANVASNGTAEEDDDISEDRTKDEDPKSIDTITEDSSTAPKHVVVAAAAAASESTENNGIDSDESDCSCCDALYNKCQRKKICNEVTRNCSGGDVMPGSSRDFQRHKQIEKLKSYETNERKRYRRRKVNKTKPSPVRQALAVFQPEEFHDCLENVVDDVSIDDDDDDDDVFENCVSEITDETIASASGKRKSVNPLPGIDATNKKMKPMDDEEPSTSTPRLDEDSSGSDLDVERNVEPDPYAAVRILIGQDGGELKTTVIRKLSLRGYSKITDTSLYYLSKLKLELLDVTRTSVSKRGVRDFMLCNPNCRIIHETTCYCRPRLHF